MLFSRRVTITTLFYVIIFVNNFQTSLTHSVSQKVNKFCHNLSWVKKYRINVILQQKYCKILLMLHLQIRYHFNSPLLLSNQYCH